MAGVRVFAVVLCVGCFVGFVGAGSRFVLGHPMALVTLSEERHWAFILTSCCLAYLPPSCAWVHEAGGSCRELLHVFALKSCGRLK